MFLVHAFTAKKNTQITTYTHTPAWSCNVPDLPAVGTVQSLMVYLVTCSAPSGHRAGAHGALGHPGCTLRVPCSRSWDGGWGPADVVIYGAPSGRHAAAHGTGGGDLLLIRCPPPAPHGAEQLAALIERPPVPRLTVLPGHTADGQRAAPVPAELR